MQFGILGPLEVIRDGQALPVGAPMQRAVLAALLLGSGQVISTDELIERLWGGHPPKTARVTLQTYVLRLRRLLGEPVIRTRAPGYQLPLEPGQLDLHRFDALLDQAHQLREQGPTEAAADALDEALRLWRGQPLADVGSDYLRRTEAVRLEERRMRAVEERTDVGLELGRHAELVNDLVQLVAAHPLRERLRGQLILALYRSGRPGDALEAYRDTRRTLIAELGIEPGRELQELQAAILSRDPALDLARTDRAAVHRPAPPRASPPTPQRAKPPTAATTGPATTGPVTTGPVTTGPAPTAAPADAPASPPGRAAATPGWLTRFVGRVREADEIIRLIAEARLLTVTGPAGCGKSRLVQHVLAQPDFDTCHYIDLAGLTDPARLPDAVAVVLGLRADQPPAEQLRDRAALLVLDNCEHLVDGCAELVLRLLVDCPGLRVLCTSREPLAVPGEHLMRLAPLPTPRSGRPALSGPRSYDSVTLFVDRAGAARPGFALTSRLAPYVEDIVRKLEGVPLAIELAAAQLGALPIEEVAARLDDQLGLLTGGNRTGRADHRTIRRAVEWSYTLLEPAEQRLFRELSVFTGGFTAAAAAAVCTPPDDSTDVFELLASLAVKSMVMAEARGPVARYRLLEPLRQFARQRLEQRGDLAGCRRRHAEHFSARARGGEPAVLAADADNLREAMSWYLSQDQVGTAMGLASAVDRLRSDAEDGPTAAGRLATHRELAILGSVAAVRGRYAQAAGLYGRALQSAEAGGGPRAIAQCLVELAELEATVGRPEPARQLLDRAAGLYLTLDDAAGLATAALLRGELEALHGDRTVARALLADARGRLRQLGVPAGTARAQLALGRVALAAGDPAGAAEPLTAALVGFHRLGDRGRVATTLEQLAAAVRSPGRAATLIGAATAVREAVEAPVPPADAAGLAATVASVRAQLDPVDYALAADRGRSRTVAETVLFACIADDPAGDPAGEPAAATPPRPGTG
ncbi:MAG TPA: BTAD domain-containing putative transcriptional regulator [Mycobacteriales bacterium]|nr:BTAD domain-containing putative transcriptional regulator [Mycobacteriales bacterium]